MPSSIERYRPNSDIQQKLASGGAEPPSDSDSARRDRRPNNRRLGEVCPEVMLIMPFAVPLLLAMWLRKWLRRRVGQKAGNVVGKAAIITFAGPPLLIAFVAVLLMRLAFMVLDKLDQAARAWRGA
jgi:hypothetical protein